MVNDYGTIRCHMNVQFHSVTAGGPGAGGVPEGREGILIRRSSPSPVSNDEWPLICPDLWKNHVCTV